MDMLQGLPGIQGLIGTAVPTAVAKATPSSEPPSGALPQKVGSDSMSMGSTVYSKAMNSIQGGKLPDYCGDLGKLSADGNIRIYTREECEQKLNGIFHASGECTKKDGGSYSWDCRPPKPGGMEVIAQKVGSMPGGIEQGLGGMGGIAQFLSSPAGMMHMNQFLKPIRDAQAAMQKTLVSIQKAGTASQQTLNQLSGQITQLLQANQPAEAEAEAEAGASENAATTGGGRRKQSRRFIRRRARMTRRQRRRKF